MKIERKIILSNVFNLALIVLIGSFAIQNLNQVLTKFRFIEIADDLNVSFLEMRLSEKNFFLYKDESALPAIKTSVEKTLQIMDSVKEDIVRAIGESQYDELVSYLTGYQQVTVNVMKRKSRDKPSEWALRSEGRKLKEFSDRITRLERQHINEIIQRSKRILFASFFAILLTAIIVSRAVSKKILRPIQEIEVIAKSISGGDFKKIDIPPPNDELGSVIQAINSMSEELKDREEELLQSKKLASIGILIAGVAHEINNPLNNISMVAQTYDDLYERLTDEQRKNFIQKVETETERIKSIVNNLLDFSKPKEPSLNEASVNQIITNTMKLVQNMLDVSNIETVVELTEDLPPVFVDDHQIQQVLVNLVVNAIQSMSPGGRLTITSRLSADGASVETNVRDNGKGIPTEFLPHLFDPFFSTKEEGGTGLGLWVSYGIVKKHNGNIKVESRPGEGTVFTVQLPILLREGVTDEQQNNDH